MATDDKNTSKVTADRPSGGVANATAADPASPPVGVTATPEESPRASMRVVPGWPCQRFEVEDIPEILSTGTMLTKTQLAKAEEAAEICGVVLISEEVK